jgi:hypothetical protein
MSPSGRQWEPSRRCAAPSAVWSFSKVQRACSPVSSKIDFTRSVRAPKVGGETPVGQVCIGHQEVAMQAPLGAPAVADDEPVLAVVVSHHQHRMAVSNNGELSFDLDVLRDFRLLPLRLALRPLRLTLRHSRLHPPGFDTSGRIGLPRHPVEPVLGGLGLEFPDHGKLRRGPGLQHRTVPDPDPRGNLPIQARCSALDTLHEAQRVANAAAIFLSYAVPITLPEHPCAPFSNPTTGC